MTEDRKPDVVLMQFGSHLYGLARPESDVDYKGVFLNTEEEVILGEGPHTFSNSTGDDKSKNSSGDVDYDLYSLHKFIKHAIMGETFAIDMLHSNSPENSSPIWEFLVANRTKFYSKELRAYVKYVRGQAAKYGVKGSRLADIESAIESINAAVGKDDPAEIALGEIKDQLFIDGEYVELIMPSGAGFGDCFYEVNRKKYAFTVSAEYAVERLQLMYDGYGHRAKLAKENEGIDWKAVSHAFRAGYQALHIYKEGDFEYPLAENPFIMKVKNGELDYTTEVAPALEALVEEVEKASEESDLPEKVDEKFWKDWLVNTYKDLWKS